MPLFSKYDEGISKYEGCYSDAAEEMRKKLTSEEKKKSQRSEGKHQALFPAVVTQRNMKKKMARLRQIWRNMKRTRRHMAYAGAGAYLSWRGGCGRRTETSEKRRLKKRLCCLTRVKKRRLRNDWEKQEKLDWSCCEEAHDVNDREKEGKAIIILWRECIAESDMCLYVKRSL